MICPYCRDSVDEEGAVFCPSCEAAHHPECWKDNGAVCSVFGCDSRFDEGVLGCPWCDEVYIHGGVHNCMSCGEALMTPAQFREVVDGTEWVKLETQEDENPSLMLGYLRNNGVIASIRKRPGVSMLLSRAPGLYVARADEAYARRILREQAQQFSRCDDCGHVLSRGEECTYCEESGAKA